MRKMLTNLAISVKKIEEFDFDSAIAEFLNARDRRINTLTLAGKTSSKAA